MCDPFSTYVMKTKHGCWEWLGPARGGYGVWKGEQAHRVAYEQEHEDIPDGMDVCHHCDNVFCVNPEHLFLGTSADNSLDMCKKRRQWSKLTEEDVIEIRSSGLPANLLATAYPVTTNQIKKILRGESWKHITP